MQALVGGPRTRIIILLLVQILCWKLAQILMKAGATAGLSTNVSRTSSRGLDTVNTLYPQVSCTDYLTKGPVAQEVTESMVGEGKKLGRGEVRWETFRAGRSCPPAEMARGRCWGVWGCTAEKHKEQLG